METSNLLVKTIFCYFSFFLELLTPMTADRKPQNYDRNKQLFPFVSPTALAISQNKKMNELYQVQGKQGQSLSFMNNFFLKHVQNHSRRRANNKIKKLCFDTQDFRFNFNSMYS